MASEAEIYAVLVPKWGLTMEEGMLVAWSVSEGAQVTRGEELLEIETSKIANAVEAPHSGVLRRQLGKPGQTYPCGALLGVIAAADTPTEAIDAFIARQAVVERKADADGGPTPEMAAVDGRAIRLLRQGSGGKPIMLIHGFGGDLNNWLFVQGALAEHHATLAVDLPGHGASGKDLKGIENLADMAAVLQALLAGLQIAQVHVVGHSLGAAVALALARLAPEQVSSLTLISPAGAGVPPEPTFIEGFIIARNRREMTTVLGMLVANEGQIGRQMINDVLKFKRLDGAEAALRHVASLLAQETRNAEEALAGIRAPVQIIWGAADRIIPLSQARLPAAVPVHVLQDVGHMAHMEQSAQVVRLIEGWIDSQ